MRRPLWIGALALALLVAGGFAWLGQWQLGFAIQSESAAEDLTETPRPIAEVTGPGVPVNDGAAGMVVTVEGTLVAGDFRVIEQRVNGGTEGVWVAAHLAEGDAHLAVALGWAPDRGTAERAIARWESDLARSATPLQLEGRYMPPDGAVDPSPREDPTRLGSMSPAQLVNLWQPFTGLAYPGFLVLHPNADGQPIDGAQLRALGLSAIDSVPPLPVEQINWLNLFYAVEWVVFAGFAIFFWYRLARDAWEKEHELRLLREAERADPPAPAE